MFWMLGGPKVEMWLGRFWCGKRSCKLATHVVIDQTQRDFTASQHTQGGGRDNSKEGVVCFWVWEGIGF